MRIGEIAREVGVPAKTIRFWEEEGLVPEPGRTSSGYRDYEVEVVERLRFIRHAQAGGLTLHQIRQVLEIGDSGDPPCEHVGRVVADRLAEVETRIAELEDTRRHLRALTRRAAAQDPAECEGYCAIITG
jgi:DNA-binding transcriptional MerR regulator